MSAPSDPIDDLHHVMSGRGFECAHCQVNTEAIDELFQLTPRLWRYLAIVDQTLDSQPPMCVGCVETVLGRTLSLTDFETSPLHLASFTHSARLRDRLTGPAASKEGAA